MLSGWSIRNKLALALWGVTLLAFVVTGVALVLFDRLTLESRARQIMVPYAQLVSVGADTAGRAQEILDTLRANRQILEAGIVRRDGRLLAGYSSKSKATIRPHPLRPDGVYLNHNTAELFQSLQDGSHLYLVMSLDEFNRQTRNVLREFAAGVLVFLVAVTLGLRTAMQRTIVSPISTLAETLEQVRTRADYLQRVPASGTDEVARLGQSFNAMMGAIQERDNDLGRSTLFQRTILDNAAYGIVSTDPEGLVSSFNPAAERLLGYTAEEVVGKKTAACWHDPEEMARRALQLSEELGETIAPGFGVFAARPRRNLPEENEWTFIRKDGTRMPVLLSITALQDRSGQIVGFVGLTYDLTERKRAEQERLSHLEYFERVDQVDRAILGTNDLEQMMTDVLDVVLSIFGCDRAWLLYPCDPEAASWHVRAEGARQACLGTFAPELEVPSTPDFIKVFHTVMSASGPVRFGPGSGHLLPAWKTAPHLIRSMIATAIYPKGDKPYLFGLHQCSYDRIWTQEEECIMQEIGRRLADALTSLSTYRDLLESEAKYRRIVDTATEGIWVLGTDTRTSFVNAKMAEMLGYSGAEMMGRSLADFMFEEEVPDLQNKIEHRRQGLSEHYERRLRRKDGETIWTLVSASPILDDEHNFQGSFAMYTDITEKKLAEEELRLLTDELEQRVQERTVELAGKNTELEDANARLQELDHLKSMFIASMSHELRTPLNSIIGFSSILLKGWLGPVSPEQQENLATILRSGKHLLNLINDVIDVSKIEAGKIERSLEEFDMYDLVSEAIQYVENDIRKKNLKLSLRLQHQTVRTDRRRLLQCVINLMSNALKFTETGGITVETSREIDATKGPSWLEGMPVCIAVHDTGIGIAAEDIPRLFQPFVRLESPIKTTVPGTGLGLYLTRKLVAEVLRGNILCSSTVGVGSTFTICIPERTDEEGPGSRG
jgi:PAS domain S-box-containing protein